MQRSRTFWLSLALATLGVVISLLWSGKKPSPDSALEKGVENTGETAVGDRQAVSYDLLDEDMVSQPKPEIRYPEGTVAGELVISFENREDYLDYLEALARAGYAPLGQIDALLAVRIPEEALLRIATDESRARASYSYHVSQPKPPDRASKAQPHRLLAYGSSARDIVGGVPQGDGSGMLVGILDSGIEAHPQFSDVSITEIDLAGSGVAGLGADHGTSVASIISGSEGIVPEAGLFVGRVLDEEGKGNSFHLAEGIVQSVDLGVNIINMSLGLYEDSPLVRQAVRYAVERDVLLVAAAGNEGFNRMPYPAAYDEVLSVTAVDAEGRQAGFPNQSEAIDFAGPGVGVEAAHGNEGTALFSGTSAAAPFVSGTLASLMSGETAMEPAAAVALLRRNLNDAGAPGKDAVYGAGVLDWQRLRERNTEGIVDLALADIYLDPKALPGTTIPVEVTVQNRGTKWLNRAELEVLVDDANTVTFSIGTLGPGQVTSRKVYTQVPSDREVGLDLGARVLPEVLSDDVRLDNNVKIVKFGPR